MSAEYRPIIVKAPDVDSFIVTKNDGLVRMDLPFAELSNLIETINRLKAEGKTFGELEIELFENDPIVIKDVLIGLENFIAKE